MRYKESDTSQRALTYKPDCVNRFCHLKFLISFPNHYYFETEENFSTFHSQSLPTSMKK